MVFSQNVVEFIYRIPKSYDDAGFFINKRNDFSINNMGLHVIVDSASGHGKQKKHKNQ